MYLCHLTVIICSLLNYFRLIAKKMKLNGNQFFGVLDCKLTRSHLLIMTFFRGGRGLDTPILKIVF
jgi:hypothetical protein